MYNLFTLCILIILPVECRLPVLFKLNFQRHPEQNLHHSIHSTLIHSTWRSDSVNEKRRWLSINHRPIISIYKAVIPYSFTILRFSLLLRIHYLQTFQRTHQKEECQSFKTRGWDSVSFCHHSCGHPRWPVLWKPTPGFKAPWCLVQCDKLHSHGRAHWSILWL